MKRIILVVVLATLLGCAVPTNPGVTAYRSYIAENRPLAEAGTLKWSAYYEGLYSKSLAAGAPDYMLNGANDMIDFARQYESGEITQDQFHHHRRAMQASVTGRSQADAERAQAEYQRRASAVAVAIAANPIPAQSYVMPMQRQSITTDCVSNGNQITCRDRPRYNILQGGCNPDFPASCVR